MAMTPEELLAAAKAQLGPQFADINARSQAAQQAAEAQARAALGMGGAAAEYVAPIAGRISGAYGAAADSIAGYGQGFSGNVRGAMDKSATDFAAFAAQQGLDPAQLASLGVSKGAGAGDAIYAMGGYQPGVALQREGAAFGAAAAMLPDTMRRYGMLASTIARMEGTKGQKAYDAERAALNAKIPQLASTLGKDESDRLYREKSYKLDKLKADREFALDKATNRRADRAQRVMEMRLRYEEDDAKFNRWLDKEKLKWAKEEATADYNAKVAEAKAEAIEAGKKLRNPDATLSGKYGYIVDSRGKAILDAAGNKIPVAKTPKAPSRSGQVTPAKARQNRTKAIATMRKDSYGVALKIVEANPGLQQMTKKNNDVNTVTLLVMEELDVEGIADQYNVPIAKLKKIIRAKVAAAIRNVTKVGSKPKSKYATGR